MDGIGSPRGGLAELLGERYIVLSASLVVCLVLVLLDLKEIVLVAGARVHGQHKGYSGGFQGSVNRSGVVGKGRRAGR